jgi:hypothetical protein
MKMMNKFNCIDIFSKVREKSSYFRIPDTYPLNIRLGLDDNGNQCIRFLGNFEKKKVKSTKNIDVNFYQILNENIISFSLLNINYQDIFFLFCDDLIEYSKNIPVSQGFQYIVNRYEKWRVFASSKREYLSENEIKGLLGELLFLQGIAFNKYGQSIAIQGWTGPEPTKKDFIYEATWYEIKSSTQNQITINSIDQLSSNDEGHLVVYSFEKLSPISLEISLNQLTKEILKMIEFDSDKEVFTSKLIEAGFYQEEYYDNFVYRKVNESFYLVNKDFPRLERNVLNNAIVDAKYTLDLLMLDKNKEEKL